MNTVRSFWVGWGTLCIAGGGAYYFAKQSINSDRQHQREEQAKRRKVQDDLEHVATSTVLTSSTGIDTKTVTPTKTRAKGRSHKIKEKTDLQDTSTEHTLPLSAGSVNIGEEGN